MFFFPRAEELTGAEGAPALTSFTTDGRFRMRAAKVKAGNWVVQKVRGPSKSGFISERIVATKYLGTDGEKTFSHILGKERERERER